jgi:hypothetical protein
VSNKLQNISGYYPPSDRLKRQLYPYDSIESFKTDIESLFNSACRLNLIQDEMVYELEEKIYHHFMSEELIARVNKLDSHFDPDQAPDLFNILFPSLTDNQKQEFLYIMRGAIQEILSN